MYGENHPRCHITEEQVDIIIHELKRNVLMQYEIGELFDPPLCQVVISEINLGMIHKREHITYPISRESPRWLTEEQLFDVRWLLGYSNATIKAIADYFNVTQSTIKHINRGRNYYDATIQYPIRTFSGTKNAEPVETILAKRSRFAIDM